MSRNQRIGVIFGLVVSVFFLWRAFSGLNLGEVLDELRNVNIPLLIAGGIIYLLGRHLITLRWWFLLRSMVQVPMWTLYQLVTIGYMGNNVYPFRSGEVLRIFLLKQAHPVAYGRLTMTVLVERVFDGLVLLSFVIVPLLFIENASPEIRSIATVSAPIFLGATAVFFALALRPQIMRKLVELVSRLLPGKLADIVSKLSEEVIAGLAGLRTPQDLLGTIVTSYGGWMVEAVVYWLVGIAFGLEVNYLVMLMVVGVVNLAGLIPASPGQIGVFEFFVSRVLMGVGIPESEAIAFALLVHVVIWLPPTLLGFFFLVRRGLGLSAVTRARDLEVAASS